MKKDDFFIGITLLLVALVTTNCIKDEFSPSQNEDSILKAVELENVIIINPSGGDDTQQIIDAFEAAKALGDGSTVFFSEGTFQISEPIGIANFNGAVKGAGMDKTLIQDLNQEPFPIMSDAYPPGIGGGIWSSGFLVFYNTGDDLFTSISVSDMSFKFNGIAVPQYKPWHAGLLQDNLDCFIWICGNVNGIEELPNIDAKITNVAFEGSYNDAYMEGINIHEPFFICGESLYDSESNFAGQEHVKVNALIEGCTSAYMQVGIVLVMFKDSKVLLRGNTISNSLYYGTYIQDNDNTDIEISNNKYVMDCYAAIILDHSTLWTDLEDYQIPSNYLIAHNNFIIQDPADGIWIVDFIYLNYNQKTINIEVKSNKFKLNTTWGGIVNVTSSDAMIKNNKFEGSASYGIDAWWYKVDDMLVLGNNFATLDAYYGTIFLGPESSNCSAIGGDNTLAWDFGIDNILTGVTVGVPPGPSIRDALGDKIDKMHPGFDPVR
jgi:hypothetical protein